MSVQQYLSDMKKVQILLLKFIDCELNSDAYFTKFIQLIDNLKIPKNPDLFKSLLELILNIANHHHRVSDFYDKIFKILKNYKKEIQENFTNSSIFNFFESNKRLVLFLIDEKLLIIDKTIANSILAKNNNYKYYFGKELAPFNGNSRISADFEEKRRSGESNDDDIAAIIRNDLIDDFIEKTKNKSSYSMRVEITYCDTNILFEHFYGEYIFYAAFFGSIQIFNYLLKDKYFYSYEKKDVWIYSIHSNNPEMIFILEEKNIKLEPKQYEECVQEAIKCHHNDIAIYIQNNYIDKNLDETFKIGLLYYNFAFSRKELINESNIYIFEGNHLPIVKIFKENKDFDVNKKFDGIRHIFKGLL